MPRTLETSFPRQRLGFFPSPLHPLPRLSAMLGREIWAKRDDLCSGLAYGGNKIRKLEWLVADALAKGCDTLVSIGNVQSNHTRQVAAAAAAAGLDCVLVQEEWTHWDDPIYSRVGNILLSRLLGAETIVEGQGYSLEPKETWLGALERLKRAGRVPYGIPAGASDHPLGGLGYVHFTDELERQERALSIFFGTILIATCTGSTQAGLLVGFARQGRSRRVIGIDTAADAETTEAAVSKIAHATGKLLQCEAAVSDRDIIVDPRYSGPAYGVPDPRTIEAICSMARLEGIITDPVYEGKAIAGLIDLIQRGEIGRDERVLYIHLGGAPALDAYESAFRNVLPAHQPMARTQ